MKNFFLSQYDIRRGHWGLKTKVAENHLKHIFVQKFQKLMELFLLPKDWGIGAKIYLKEKFSKAHTISKILPQN